MTTINYPIEEVTMEKIKYTIENRSPIGFFYCKSNQSVVIAVDNTNEEIYIEEFKNEQQAKDWLNGEFD